MAKKKKAKKKKVSKIEKKGGSSAKVVCREEFATISISMGKGKEEVTKKKTLRYTEIPEDVPRSTVTVPLSGTFNMGNFSAIRVGVTLSGVTIDNPKARKHRFQELFQEGLEMLSIASQAAAKRMFNKDLDATEEEDD